MHEGYIYLNNKCNFNCIFCASEDTNKTEYLSPSLESIKEFVLLHSQKCDRLVISGGEPTLHFDLIKIIEFAKKYFKDIVIQTNAVRLSDYSYLVSLIEAGVTTFAIAYYSRDPSVYDFITQSSNQLKKYNSALRNVLEFVSSKEINLLFKVLLLSANQYELPDLFTYLDNFHSLPNQIFYHGVHSSNKVIEHSSVFPDYGTLGKQISQSILKFPAEYVSLNVVELPLCLLDDAAIDKLSYNGFRFQARHVSASVLNNDTNILSVNKHGTFFEECQDCLLSEYCDGINSKNPKYQLSNIKPFIRKFIL